MGDHRACGVQHHRVTHRPRGARQHLACLRRIGLGVAAHQRRYVGAGEPESRGIEGQLLHGACLDAPDGARRRRGELVEPVVTVHDQHAGAAGGEHAGHHLGQIGPRAADQPGTRRARIRQRPKEIEHRRYADLAAGRSGMPVRRMEHRREAETDADLGDAARDVVWAEVDAHPEGFQRVGAAAAGRRGPVSVLDHRHPGGRHHEGGHRREVHGVRPVAAGAHHVDGVGADLLGGHSPGVGQHRVGQLGHLGGRRPLHLHRHAESGDLCRRCGARHDLVHRPRRLPSPQRLLRGQQAEDHRPGRLDFSRSHARDYDELLHPGGVQQLQSVILAL